MRRWLFPCCLKMSPQHVCHQRCGVTDKSELLPLGGWVIGVLRAMRYKKSIQSHCAFHQTSRCVGICHHGRTFFDSMPVRSSEPLTHSSDPSPTTSRTSYTASMYCFLASLAGVWSCCNPRVRSTPVDWCVRVEVRRRVPLSFW